MSRPRPRARRAAVFVAVAVAFSLLPLAAHGQEDAAPCPADTPPAPFTDRPSIPEAHRRSVDCAHARAIAQGFSDNTYRPTAPVLRDAMASFITRALAAADADLPAPDPDRFADVAAGSSHDEAIHRLKAAGIVSGGPGGLPASRYGPRLDVRRDQMASFLVRALEFARDEQLGSSSQRFPDVGSGNPHFATVNAASEQGLAHGRADGRYGPGEAVRRDQMASFLVRLLEAVRSPETDTAPVGETGAPPSPRDVEAANESSAAEGRVRVSWAPLADPHGRLAGYNVYYGEGETNTRAGSGTTTADADATTFTVAGLGVDVDYTFAVTAVTSDGHESDKSSAVTVQTRPPGVRITEPTAQTPAVVGPSATVQVRFDAYTPEGGTYRVAYREHDAAAGAAWTNFPETPDGTPGEVPAGAGTRTRTVTAPSQAATYDLRVVLTPTGAAASVQDVASAALRVVSEPGDPTVEITRPTTAGKAQVFPGGELTVAFTAGDAGSYRLERRSPGGEWTAFSDDATEGTAARGANEVTVTAPGTDGLYDLRASLEAPSGAASNVQPQAIRVASATVKLTAPTSSSPAEVAEDGDRAVEVTFEYTTNAERTYRLRHRPSGATGWTDFDPQATGPVSPGGPPVTTQVTAPEQPGTYDLRVEIVGVPAAEDQQSGAISVTAAPQDPAVTITSPTRHVPPDEAFPITFQATHTGTYVVQRRVSDPEGEWTTFADDDATGTVTETNTDIPVDLTAPSAEDTYDLRVELTPDGQAPTDDVKTGGVVVTTDIPPDEVEITDVDSPVDPGDDFAVTFTFTVPDEEQRTYVLAWSPAGEDDWTVFDDEGTGTVTGTGGGASETVTLTAPADPGTYDLRIQLDAGAGVTAEHTDSGSLVVEEDEPECELGEDPSDPLCIL